MQDNPPAFPTDGRIQHGTAYDGMSLRDYFAGQAIPALIALSAEDKLIKFVGETTGQCVARSAFEIADAMLAARSRPDAE